MDRSMNKTSTLLNLFDIVASTATGIAARVTGADRVSDDVFDSD